LSQVALLNFWCNRKAALKGGFVNFLKGSYFNFSIAVSNAQYAPSLIVNGSPSITIDSVSDVLCKINSSV